MLLFSYRDEVLSAIASILEVTDMIVKKMSTALSWTDCVMQLTSMTCPTRGCRYPIDHYRQDIEISTKTFISNKGDPRN